MLTNVKDFSRSLRRIYARLSGGKEENPLRSIAYYLRGLEMYAANPLARHYDKYVILYGSSFFGQADGPAAEDRENRWPYSKGTSVDSYEQIFQDITGHASGYPRGVAFRLHQWEVNGVDYLDGFDEPPVFVSYAPDYLFYVRFMAWLNGFAGHERMAGVHYNGARPIFGMKDGDILKLIISDTFFDHTTSTWTAGSTWAVYLDDVAGFYSDAYGVPTNIDASEINGGTWFTPPAAVFPAP